MAVYPAGAYAVANAECLYRNSESALQAGDIDCTIICWAYVASQNATLARALVAKWDAAGATREFLLRAGSDAADNYQFYVNPTGSGTSVSVSATTYGAVTLNQWVMLVAYHDATANTIGISVNGGAFDTAAYSSGIYVGASQFIVGSYNYVGYSAMDAHDGRIGPVGYAKGYVLTSGDITELYNSGNGRLWAQLSSGLKTKFGSAWWDMTETSGTRASQDGKLNLTDYNTVTYGDGPILVPPAGGFPWHRFTSMEGGIHRMSGGLQP